LNLPVTATGSTTARTLADWMSYLNGVSNPNPVVFGGQVTANANILAALTMSTAPSSFCSTDSFSVAFSCDLSHTPFAEGLNINGTATLGQPSTGYIQNPNTAMHMAFMQNSSGWNQSTSGNSGRTGVAAYYTSVIQAGQADAGAYFANVFINSTKAGATSFLAEPAGTILSGQVNIHCAHCYAAGIGDIDINDNGFDSAAIGQVFNLSRTIATAALGDTWIGQRISSNGTAAVDAFASYTGPAVIGIDMSAASFTKKAAITLPHDVGIYFNSSASGCCSWPYQTTVGTTYLSYSNSLTALAFVVDNSPAFLISAGQVSVVSANGLAITNGTLHLTNSGNWTAPSSCGSLTSSTKCIAVTDPNGNTMFIPAYGTY
jgi:hypothetical protein